MGAIITMTEPKEAPGASRTPATYDEWYQQWFPGLVRYARARTADWQEAEDLAMDTAIRLLDRWDKRRPEHPTAWAFAVLANALRSRRRRARRRHLPLVDDVAEASLDRHLDLDLLDAIDQLPDRQREAIRLRYLGDLRQEDVALVMGVKRGTASALLSQGRANLRGRLER